MENKQKNPNINRAAYITILTLLAVMAILVVATSSANRARRQGSGDSTTPAVTTAPTDVTTPSAVTKPPLHTSAPETTNTPETTAAPETTKAPETTAAPADVDSPDEPVAEKLPELILPVSGNLIAAHDLEVPVWSNTMADYRVHCGMDIAASPGASVCAAADGVIAQIWEDPMMGQCISVKHAGDGTSIYRNLSTVIPVGIAEGVAVRAGQLIANIGESAMIEIAEEPHLHFELMIGDDYVNPLDYLSASVKTGLAVDENYEG